MSFTVEDVIRLRDGWRDLIAVGDLSIEAAEEMGVYTTMVYLSRESLQHINEEHPDISDTDLLIASLVIKDGMVMREKSKTNAYVCSYEEPYSRLRYVATLKVAAPDREILMTSFRRSRKRQTKAFLRRCKLIKKHS
jgi:hypothetical protein